MSGPRGPADAAMSLVLHGYHYSVYNRIARLALAEKGVAYDRVEVNPFAPTSRPPTWRCIPSAGCRPWSMTASRSTRPAPSPAMSTAPFPARRCSRPAPSARPHGPVHRHRRFLRLLADGPAGLLPSRIPRPRPASRSTRRRSARGLAGAAKVLAALEALAVRAFLVGPELSLADLHLGAMVAYFALAPEGAALLQDHPRLAAWWAQRQPACELCRDRSWPAPLRHA